MTLSDRRNIKHPRPGMKLLLLLVLVAGSTAIATMEPIKKSIDYQLGTPTGAGAVSQQSTSAANMHASPSPVITDEIKIVDSQGHPRIIMSAKSGNPVIRLLQANGAPGVEVVLDSTGHPAVKLANPDMKGPIAALAVDDKSTHVKFDRPGGYRVAIWSVLKFKANRAARLQRPRVQVSAG
jgi:hypothetical protein